MWSFQKIAAYLMHNTWDLAIGFYEEDKISTKNGFISEAHIIKNPYSGKWFADPFILKRDNNIVHLLVEEFDKDVKRGRIARIEIDLEKKVISQCKIILDLPTHLSFPAIYYHEGNIYVHPENSKSGDSIMYLYDLNEDKLVCPRSLVNRPLADAIIRESNGQYEMTATEDPSPNGNVLLTFTSDSLLGPYQFKKKDSFSSNIARMAGKYLHTSNGDLRPAQDCNGDYGKAVLFMNEKEIVGKITPKGFKYSGVHTFNVGEGLFVIDLKKQDFPFVYFVRCMIKSLF